MTSTKSRLNQANVDCTWKQGKRIEELGLDVDEIIKRVKDARNQTTVTEILSEYSEQDATVDEWDESETGTDIAVVEGEVMAYTSAPFVGVDERAVLTPILAGTRFVYVEEGQVCKIGKENWRVSTGTDFRYAMPWHQADQGTQRVAKERRAQAMYSILWQEHTGGVVMKSRWQLACMVGEPNNAGVKRVSAALDDLEARGLIQQVNPNVQTGKRDTSWWRVF